MSIFELTPAGTALFVNTVAYAMTHVGSQVLEGVLSSTLGAATLVATGTGGGISGALAVTLEDVTILDVSRKVRGGTVGCHQPGSQMKFLRR